MLLRHSLISKWWLYSGGKLETKVLELREDKHPYLKEIQPNELGFIGTSSGMQEIYSIIKQIAPLHVDVNVIGESGTGKELVAKALHYQHPHRKSHPFSAINCGSLPGDLLESMLFGIEEKTATGVKGRIGLIENSNQGTLFLDEIVDMSPKMQVDLLRVLQEREVLRIGGHESKKLDIRVVTAASKPIIEAVNEKKFRSDLFYRISVVPILIPPLRERGEDIIDLAKYFCGKHSDKFNFKVSFDNSVYSVLKSYSWPGNVRELETTIERVVALNGKNNYEVQLYEQNFNFLKNSSVNDITQSIKKSDFLVQNFQEEINLALGLSQLKKDYEKKVMLYTLEKTKGNVKEAANLLGRERAYVYKIMKDHGIKPYIYKK
jgi:DNA-binding NtrC family response regulator